MFVGTLAVTTPISKSGPQSALRDSVRRTLLAKLRTHEGEVDASNSGTTSQSGIVCEDRSDLYSLSLDLHMHL